MRDPLSLLQLELLGVGRFRAPNEGDPARHDVVFGGQLLGQMIIAASASHPGKQVRTLHTIFARAARVSAETQLAVEPLHDGRSFASANVTAWQGERLCARALVLPDAPEPDLMHHAAPMPRVEPPEQAKDPGPSPLVFPGAELRIVGVRNHPRWDSDIELWLDSDTPIGVGTVIHRRNKRSGTPVEGTMEVVEFEQNRVLAMVIHDGPAEMRGRTTFEAISDHQTKITQVIDIPGMAETADRSFLNSRLERSSRLRKQLMEAEL